MIEFNLKSGFQRCVPFHLKRLLLVFIFLVYQPSKSMPRQIKVNSLHAYLKVKWYPNYLNNTNTMISDFYVDIQYLQKEVKLTDNCFTKVLRL